MSTGADGCVFPSATVGLLKNRIEYDFVFARLFCGASVCLGGRTCFPGRDCVHRRVHCCIALFDRFLFVHVVRACCGWTLFSGSVGARALVCAVLHPLTPGVSVARPLHGGFHLIERGRSGLGFQRNSELAFSNLSVPAVP